MANTNSKNKTLFIFFGVCLLALPSFYFLNKYKSSGPSSSLVPNKKEAEKIFKTLHRNIYDTFNEKDEILAYDRLEKSVDNPFLEHVYKEIYHYFKGMQKGGPSIEIVDVKIRSFEKIKMATGPLESRVLFKVQANWDVLCIVTHQKHWHPRTNNFKAVYTLGLIQGEWKIVKDEILWQRRIPVNLDSFKS